MKGMSIIMPFDYGREEQFVNTIEEYEKYGVPDDVELVIVTRSFDKGFVPWEHKYKIVTYDFEGKSFNPSMALNLGVKNATYNNVVITCPEVKPLTNVLQQLKALDCGNYVTQVFDENEHGEMFMSLVNSSFRSQTPAMYFLACFKKEDILKINGWDEDFMNGYAYEDDDFGFRFVSAGNTFEVRDEIQSVHQYHQRGSMSDPLTHINRTLYYNNVKNGVTRCENGLMKRNE